MRSGIAVGMPGQARLVWPQQAREIQGPADGQRMDVSAYAHPRQITRHHQL
jgi:hypothetical protein